MKILGLKNRIVFLLFDGRVGRGIQKRMEAMPGRYVATSDGETGNVRRKSRGEEGWAAAG
jgi:hypothetical protein